MKKVIPISNDAPPPLMIAKFSQQLNLAPAVPNAVTPVVIRPRNPLLGSPIRAPNLRLVQTADGRKILLTNVVSTTKAVANGPLLLLSTSASPSASTADCIQSPRASTTTANKFHTVRLTSSLGEKSFMLPVPNINHPVIMKAKSAPTVVAETSSIKQQKVTNPGGLPVTVISNPVISASKTGMYVNNGQSRFRIIGKPIPVTLGKRPTETTTKSSDNLSLESNEELQSPALENSGNSVSSFQSSSSGKMLEKPSGTSTPPAYLNIQVKEEPEDETEAKIKVDPDGPMSILDVRIKEEDTDEQSALLASDEELRDVLDVATQQMKRSPKPRFYVRTSEGKLVCISNSEAEAIGLNYNDNREQNQMRLIEALKKCHRNEKNLLKIPGDTDILDFVSCNVPEEVKKVAASVKNTGNQQIKLEKDTGCGQRFLIPADVKVQDFVNRNIPEEVTKTYSMMRVIRDTSLKEKYDPDILGEVTINNQRFLRIRIRLDETEPKLCDLPISDCNAYHCPFCGKSFKIKSRIVAHVRVHTGERPYPCDVCGKRYRQRIDIIRHMRIHTGEKPFTCGVCNASFNQKSNLRSHMRIHTGERPVQCKVCGKDFSRNTHLKQHLKLHTGEKPYKCKVCGRPFRFKSGLQAHERIHSGLKPYACSLCGRSFTQIVGLIRHERTHVGEKPFRCQNCGKSFDTRETLQVHCKKHTDVRPHACEMCNKTFTDVTALHCHVKKYHRNTLICVICHKENFKSRIELREHLRGHERENWQETADGDLVPSELPRDGHYVSVDDIGEDCKDFATVEEGQQNSDVERSDSDFNTSFNDSFHEEIQVEVELDPDDPMQEDDDDDDESEYEEHQFQIESDDPLA